MKILLLEDDELLNEIMEEYLISLGYEVVSVYDPKEALELISDDSFQFLVLDVNVPSLSEFDLLNSFKSNNVNIPTVFISSLHTSKHLEEDFNFSSNEYIKKPFQLNELQLRINSLKAI